MTCVWDSLLRHIVTDSHSMNVLGCPRSPGELVRALKANNIGTPDVRWQGQLFSPQQQGENAQWIRKYDETRIGEGHLTSMCDPFMILLCQLLHVSIKYKGERSEVVFSVEGARREWTVCSSSTHMW